jgi:type IV pilus assembly protein PilM
MKRLTLPTIGKSANVDTKPITSDLGQSSAPSFNTEAVKQVKSPKGYSSRIAAPDGPVTPISKADKADIAGAPAEAPGKAKDNAKHRSRISMPKLSLGGGMSGGAGKRILSLTIEGTNIRIVVYNRNAIERWNSIAFDSNLIKTGQVADPERLGEVIKGAIQGFEPGKFYTVCALSGLRSVSRIINIPNISKKEMEMVIPREVRKIMTVSEADNYFHWQVLPSTGAQARVFVLAVPKEPLSALLEALSHAGIRPKDVDLKPLALMRAVNQKDAIIANCENNSIELVIVADDVPVLIRSVFLSEGIVTQDYAVGRISDELGRTIVTYNEINKEHPLDPNVPIYLTGAAAAGVPFALNVAALTGRTVQPLESPIICPENFPLAEYMVNLGLILKVI